MSVPLLAFVISIVQAWRIAARGGIKFVMVKHRLGGPAFGGDGQRVMSPEKWVNNIRELLRLVWLNEPSINLLCEVLMDEYEKRGILKSNE
jgi:hypothetical protein